MEFTFDPAAFVARQRHKLVVDALTIIRALVAARSGRARSFQLQVRSRSQLNDQRPTQRNDLRGGITLNFLDEVIRGADGAR